MYTLLKSQKIQEELIKRNLRIFSPLEFERIFDLSPQSTKYFLETQVHNKLLSRLKRGVYSLNTNTPIEEEISNALYKPSYISFEYALAYYNLLPEMPYVITSATTKPTRLYVTSGKTYSYRTIKREAYTGYVIVRQGNAYILIAEREKAIVDYLYFVSLHKAPPNDRLMENICKLRCDKTRRLDKTKIRMHVRMFSNSKLTQLINTLI